jgi:hypothetical protein
MAVTTESSTELTQAYQSAPENRLRADQWGGKLRVKHFTFTQGAAAGDANSYAKLVDVGPGPVTIYPSLSYVAHSAFGSSRTLDIGLAAYTQPDGTAVIADEDAIDAAVDVSGAGSFTPAGTVTAERLSINSRGAVVIQAKCESGTLPAGATLKGYIVYSVE